MKQFRSATVEDTKKLVAYFDDLSDQTKAFFAPHSFDLDTLGRILLGQADSIQAFLCEQGNTPIAYAAVKQGYTDGERYRFPLYGIPFAPQQDYLFAPSVSDAHQGQGIGGQLLAFTESKLRKQGAKKLILWGVVQLRNQRAVQYYLKNGFEKLGQFHHEGLDNWDMAKVL